MTPVRSNHRAGFWIVLCHVLGALILLTVFMTAGALSVPRLFGREAYHVLSGSMEPAIPVGSVIYVRAAKPEEICPGDVISFYQDGMVVAHRVIENRLLVGEFVTKGDANPREDPQTVPYASFIGLVTAHIPYIGSLLYLLAGTAGKVYMLIFAACGLLFHLLAFSLRDRSTTGKPLERP